MTTRFRNEDAVTLRFGGGRNSRASEDQISPLECTDGENFILDPGNGEFRPRPPFDLVATATNGEEIRGFATLRRTDGTVSFLVQAGSVVYEMDESYDFTQVGTVSSAARIRGPKEAFWALGDKVLITDLALEENIREWDGTTFQEVAFLQSDGSSSFGSFRAKYCVVENERAFFANIWESAQAFPHLLVASERSDYTIISASDRPSSSLGDDAPFFLPVPQLKPINGLATVFGILVISQEKGAFEKLSGDSAKNYSLNKLHPGSGATGVEAVVSTGNDIIYGALGKIESLESTDKFGDVELDDLSFKIQPDIKTYDEWTLVYNPNVRRIYCFPDGANECHVLHTDFIGSELSPWSKFTTIHGLQFQPTAAMLCVDPADGLEYVFMGDVSGNIYRMEGTGSGDGGDTDITAFRISNLMAAPLDGKAFRINGWLQHRVGESATLKMTFIFQGEHINSVSQNIAFVEEQEFTPYGGEVYYGGSFYYGSKMEGKLARRIYSRSGQSNLFQVKHEVTGQNDFSITEQGIRFDTAG